PRKRVAQSRRVRVRQWYRPTQHLLIGAEHALRVDDALWRPGGSRRVENLCDRIRTYQPSRVVYRAGGRGLPQLGEGDGGELVSRGCGDNSIETTSAAGERSLEQPS